MRKLLLVSLTLAVVFMYRWGFIRCRCYNGEWVRHRLEVRHKRKDQCRVREKVHGKRRQDGGGH